MAGIFGRIFKQWAEEAVVNKLADSKSFQKAAVSVVEGQKQLQAAAEEAMKDPTKVKEGIGALWQALRQEMEKDVSKWTAEEAPKKPSGPRKIE